MSRLGRTGLAALAATAVLLVPAASAGAGPTARASGEELVTYLTTGKLVAGRTMTYQIVCGAPATVTCNMTASSELKIKGAPNLGPLRSSAVFPGQTTVVVEFKVSKPAKKFIRKNIKKVKLKTEISATRSDTGEVDTDEQTFKLKK